MPNDTLRPWPAEAAGGAAAAAPGAGSEGGPASDWARLIVSLGVLGEMDRAEAIWAEAQTRFADHPQDLAVVEEAARQAGLIQ